MNIGKASEISGISAKMIRYYEQIGLISKANRSRSGYRVYNESDIHTLGFIRRARDLGFTVKQIEELTGLWRDSNRSSSEVKMIAMAHIANLQSKIEELEKMMATLHHLAENCQGDERPECPILEGLQDGKDW